MVKSGITTTIDILACLLSLSFRSICVFDWMSYRKNGRHRVEGAFHSGLLPKGRSSLSQAETRSLQFHPGLSCG